MFHVHTQCQTIDKHNLSQSDLQKSSPNTTPLSVYGYTTPLSVYGYTTPLSVYGYTTPLSVYDYTTPLSLYGYTTLVKVLLKDATEFTTIKYRL